MSKVISVEEAVGKIPEGATIAISGTGPVQDADVVFEAIERRFLAEGKPGGLTLFSLMLPGYRAGIGGFNCFAHDGMLRRIISPSFSALRHPRMLELIRAEKIEGYVLGMGAAVQLFSAIGSRKPGVFTTAGLGSFLDPRVEAGAMNARSTRPLVQLETIAGKEYLFYPSFPVNVAIIRGTTADENGYVSMEEEPNTLGMLEMALAAKASGGIVIAQVKRVARAHSLDPRLVRIPGPLVDMVVVNAGQTQVSPEMCNPAHGWNPFLAGAMKMSYAGIPAMPLDTQKLILRRAALELKPDDVVNLGAGVATQMPRIALEENILDRVVITNEHGVFGGLMATATGGSFVPAYNADAVMDTAFQFNFYDGGGLDAAFLGVGQIDAEGNVNVSKFDREWNGTGGFNDITDITPRIVICGSLTSGGLKVEIGNGGMRIAQEGRFRKFVERVEQITLNAPRAFAKGQSVIYITERAVFRLGPQGPELAEVAPGIDIERDIRPHIGFPLRISAALKIMDARIYREGPMGLDQQFQGGILC